MTGLADLFAAPGGHSMEYFDPAFPDRPLLLHSARPRRFDRDTPVLIVHHGVGRNGRDYRDYWLRLVDEAGIVAIAVEFTEDAFPDYLWYTSATCMTTRARPIRVNNGRTASTAGCLPHCATRD